MPRASCLFILVAVCALSHAAGGPLGIDHRWNYDNSGVWSRRNQDLLRYGGIAADVGLALWEGGETRLGDTAWRSVDAVALSGLTAEAGKRAFGRLRPAETGDPSEWRKGGKSFPSGEVAEISGIVAPYVLEYGADHPGVYALELLPAYDAVARMKVQAHWQTDVLAGFALGTLSGYFAHRESSPFLLSVLPSGVSVGLRKTF